MSKTGPDADGADGLPISTVAARTGVSVATLRAWERRFGFPRPQRLEGGHRRYADDELERIREVAAERAAGRSLEAAIALVTAAHPRTAVGPGADASVFAALRRRHPDLAVHALSRRAMLAVSKAIEDECCARADRPYLAAAFQHQHAYTRARRRWDGLHRTAAASVVFADFARSRRRGQSVVEVSIPGGAPQEREWSVVCDAPGSAAVLAGWERADGRFEAVWSAEPTVVRTAIETSWDLARAAAPKLVLPPLDARPVVAAGQADVGRRATALTNRVVAYLDGST